MRILLVDDERLPLEDLEETVKSVLPDEEYKVFKNAKEALLEAESEHFDLAFLDVEMPGVNGLELANKLKEIYPKTNIVFVTAYKKYAFDAHGIMSTGYFLKPLKKDDVRNVIANLRYSIEDTKKIKIRCFGNFEVFANGKTVTFRRSLSKEIFAYLVDKRGSIVTRNEMIKAFWPKEKEIAKADKRFYMSMSELKKGLSECGFDDVLIHGNVGYGIDVNKVDCDYYNYISGNSKHKESYLGEYMSQYIWAKETRKILKKIG